MIAKKEWFNRRKYSGWGLTPKTWQGFAYIGIIILIGFAMNSSILPGDIKIMLSAILVTLLIADVLHVMATIKIDEREAKIEALAERNASWTMVGSLAVLLIYLGTVDRVLTCKEFMPYIIFPMISGMIAKAVSTYILQNRDL